MSSPGTTIRFSSMFVFSSGSGAASSEIYCPSIMFWIAENSLDTMYTRFSSHFRLFILSVPTTHGSTQGSFPFHQNSCKYPHPCFGKIIQLLFQFSPWCFALQNQHFSTSSPYIRPHPFLGHFTTSTCLPISNRFGLLKWVSRKSLTCLRNYCFASSAAWEV